MWFLDKKIKKYLKHVEQMRRYLFRLSQYHVQDDVDFSFVDGLFTQFNRLAHQILRQINTFEKATETMGDTLYSFLPWSEAYALRCSLTESLELYERFCDDIATANQFLQKGARKPQPYFEPQLSLPKSESQITYKSLVPYSRTEIPPKITKNSDKLSDDEDLQEKDINLSPKNCLQKNPANQAGKYAHPNSLDKLNSENRKLILITSEVEAREEIVTKVHPEKETTAVNQRHSFWQVLFPPAKSQYKTINEWLSLPARRFN